MQSLLWGAITEEKLNSFNFPNYFPSIKELKMVIEMNNCFKYRTHWHILKHPTENLLFDVEKTTAHMRSIMEGLIGEHFGNEIINELFKN